MEINALPFFGVIHICSHKEQRTVWLLGKTSLARTKPTSSVISAYVWCHSSFMSSPRHFLLCLESFFTWDWRHRGISVPRQHRVQGLVGSLASVPWAPHVTKGEIALGDRILFLLSGHWWPPMFASTYKCGADSNQTFYTFHLFLRNTSGLNVTRAIVQTRPLRHILAKSPP